MKEELISFETAKLAKEKGFDLKTQSYYGRCFPEIEFEIFCDNLDVFGGDFSCYAPTKSLLQKWLREKHYIHINIGFVKSGYFWHIIVIPKYDYEGFKELDDESDIYYKTYEEALEIGLQEGLKLL